MKKHREIKNSNPYQWLSRIGLGLGLILFSQKVGVGQFNYIPDVIKIVVRESSPPSLALAEVNAEYIDNTIAAKIPPTSLKVGLALLPQLELEEILIGELEQIDSQLLNKNENLISSNEISQERSTKDEGNTFGEGDVYPQSLSSQQLSRLKIAQEKYRVLDQVWTEPQVAEEAMGDKIQRLNSDLKIEEQKVKQKNGVVVKGESSGYAQNSSASVNSDSGNSSAVNVEGLIEFSRKANLVLTPEHHIEVRRFAEGIAQEFGVVRLPEATFNIHFQSTYGSIVAQLINANGVVEGQGVLAVQDLIKSKNYRPTIVIEPSSKGNIQVVSAYGPSFLKDFHKSLGFDIFGSMDYVQPLPKDTHFDNSYADSQAVIQVTAKNHLPTTAIISLADGADLMLLPEKMINGLVDILSEQGISLNLQAGDSLIWGQVRKNGKPIEGATIFAERTDPIYFGGMQLPDQLRTSTSDNGMFVVVVNQPGWKDLFVQMEDGAKVHLNVLTFPGKVSQVFADLPSRDLSVSVRSFDAFSGEPARAKVQIQQIEDMVDTGDLGISVVNVPFTQSFSFVNVYPEAPYVDAKFSYTKLNDYIHLPMVRREWLDEMAKQARINPDPGKGIIIGFVQNSNFNFIPSAPEHSNEFLIYFNANGELVDSGVAGGGFILYNQTPGFAAVTLEDKKHQRKFHKIAFPENRFISVLSFAL